MSLSAERWRWKQCSVAGAGRAGVGRWTRPWLAARPSQTCSQSLSTSNCATNHFLSTSIQLSAIYAIRPTISPTQKRLDTSLIVCRVKCSFFCTKRPTVYIVLHSYQIVHIHFSPCLLIVEPTVFFNAKKVWNSVILYSVLFAYKYLGWSLYFLYGEL